MRLQRGDGKRSVQPCSGGHSGSYLAIDKVKPGRVCGPSSLRWSFSFAKDLEQLRLLPLRLSCSTQKAPRLFPNRDAPMSCNYALDARFAHSSELALIGTDSPISTTGTIFTSFQKLYFEAKAVMAFGSLVSTRI